MTEEELKIAEELKVTGKQKQFAYFYTHDANMVGVVAAKLAGYSGDENTLAVTASRLLRNAKVVGMIDKHLKDAGMGANEAITRLVEHARGSLADLLDDSGKFNLKEAKAKGKDRLLKELTVIRDKENKTITYKYKIHDSQAAIDKILKVHGKYVEKHEHTGKDGAPIKVEQSNQDLSKLSTEELLKLKEIQSKLNAS